MPFILRLLGVLLVLLVLAPGPALAQVDAEAATPASAKPMAEVPDKRLNRVLQRYYQDALGGEETWGRLLSLRIDGRIVTPEGAFDLRAYQKKPDLLKMTLKRDDLAIVLGYDGENTWKIEPGRDPGTAVPMEPAEARRFIHNARFDTYLLYPLAPGKSIEYVGLAEENGASFHHVRVTLESGFVMEYFLDLTAFLVHKVISRDTLDESVNAIEYFDYTRVLGKPMARRLVNSENGRFTSEFTVDRIAPNLGMARWMFEPPRTAGGSR